METVVRFSVLAHSNFGESICIIGSDPNLGAWKGVIVEWENFDGNRIIQAASLKSYEHILAKDECFNKNKGKLEGVVRTSLKKEECKDLTFKVTEILKERLSFTITWKEKLDLIKDIITGMGVQKNELIAIDRYLWLISNKDPIDGANDYYNSLLLIYSNLIGKFNKENNLIIRSILSRLPAFSGTFYSFNPSIQVKELINRDDVPTELKEEVKSILHDKFSACANIKDLEIAQKILSRIKMAGTYTHELVVTFERFTEQVKEYFAGNGFELLLTTLGTSLEVDNHTNSITLKEAINAFLSSKGKLHTSPLNCIKNLYALREFLVELRKPFVDPSIFAYAWNADLQLENFLNVILGSFLSSAITPLKNDEELDSFLHIILYALKNLKLSDYETQECYCIENGLLLFISMTSNATLYYLRLKSILERTERMIQAILANTFASNHLPVLKEHDNLARSHIVVPLLGLVIKAKEYISIRLGYSFMAVLKGRAKGTIKFNRRLSDNDVILFADEIDEEEIPNNVKGIIIEKNISLLTYIRIKRANIISAICNDTYKKLKSLVNEEGKFELTITSESITLNPCLDNHKSKSIFYPLAIVSLITSYTEAELARAYIGSKVLST